jgi:hypothetical protein
MQRAFFIALVTAAALAVGASAAEPPIRHFAQSATPGFYRGQTVEYLDFGPIELRPGNKVAPIWVFTNGAAGQVNVIDTVPGQQSYTPLWAVNMVTWKDESAARILRSAAAVRQALAAGRVTISRPGIVVNCPVI